MQTTSGTSATASGAYIWKTIDIVKYNALSATDKITFDKLKKAMLEIIPTMPNSIQHSDDAFKLAENSAFANLKVFTEDVVKMVNEKIAVLEATLNTKIDALAQKVGP